MHVVLSPLNAIGCVTTDWIPYLRLCINLNGGHIEHIVSIQAVFTFFTKSPDVLWSTLYVSVLRVVKGKHEW